MDETEEEVLKNNRLMHGSSRSDGKTKVRLQFHTRIGEEWKLELQQRRK